MKTKISISSILVLAVFNSFGQSTETFKTVLSLNPVYYSTDGSRNDGSLALVPATGALEYFGTVNYEIYSAPVGTPAPTWIGFLDFDAGWSATAVGPVTYFSAGVISSLTVTLPAASGVPGAPVEMVIVAYTGTLAEPTLYAYSGEMFAGASSVTVNGQTTSVGALEWSQGTGNASSTPAMVPPPLVTGSAGFGSLVLAPDGESPVIVPEPSVIALSCLGASSLLFLRYRRKS